MITVCTTCTIAKDDSLFPQWRGKRSGRKCNDCRATAQRKRLLDPKKLMVAREASKHSMRSRRADPIVGEQLRATDRKRAKEPKRADQLQAAQIKHLQSVGRPLEYHRAKSKEHYANNKHQYMARYLTRKRQLETRTIEGSFNDARIAAIYRECPEGCHVDHIVPLNGKNVSGLHVWWNLQYLSANQNLTKRNKFSPDNYDTWLMSGENGPFLG